MSDSPVDELPLSSAEHPGHIGEALWNSALERLPTPPWAPLSGFVTLFFGKARTGHRVLWVFGGSSGSEATNATWRSDDGAATWERVRSRPKWSPRSWFGVAAGSTHPEPNPKAVIYVIGGIGARGLCADVWASDTLGRTWHCMTQRAPFGARTDVMCATVPGDPCSLVVGGGMSTEPHRDLWLSRDLGERFVQIDLPELPPLATLVQFGSAFLCAARCGNESNVSLWHVRLHLAEAGVSQSETKLSEVERIDEQQDFGDLMSWRHPLRIGLDLQANVVLWWDATARCLAARSLSSDSTAELLRGICGPQSDCDVLCDMDSLFASLRRGRMWVLSQESGGIWASSPALLLQHLRFLRLLGARLSAPDAAMKAAAAVGKRKVAALPSLPAEVWEGRIVPLVLPVETGKSRTLQRQPVDSGRRVAQHTSA